MKLLRAVRAAILSPVIDVVLPESCWAKNSGDNADNGPVEFGLAAATRAQIAQLSAQRYCLHCGLGVGPYETHDARNPCGRCGERILGVLRIARVGTFTDPLITLIHRLKFGRTWEIAGVLAPFLYQSLARASEQSAVPVDLIVPVPLHWSRRIRRGFNQADELARELTALSGWKVADILRRRRHTHEQALTESRTARLENLRGAFTATRHAGPRVAGKHIWLLDDVSTTGATLHAAASALRRLPLSHRPASVNAAVICITDQRTPPTPDSDTGAIW